MKSFNKYVGVLSLAFLLSAIPAVAQMENAVRFHAPFAFSVGSKAMPAGTYRVTQPDINVMVLLIQDVDGSSSTFVTYRPVDMDTPPAETRIGFNRYGDADFLNRISIAGESVELQVSESHAEEVAAEGAVAEEHSIPAAPRGSVPAASAGAPSTAAGN